MKSGLFDDSDWEAVRLKSFHGLEAINLNTATLGVPLQEVISCYHDTLEQSAFPLAQYQLGRVSLQSARVRAQRIWHTPDHALAFGLSTTQTTNLLANAIAYEEQKQRRVGPISLLTTCTEHQGGIGAFEKNPAYQVHAISHEDWQCERALREHLQNKKPSVIFLSHVSYVDGHSINAKKIAEIIKKELPKSLLILDVAQSLGVMAIPFDGYDFIVGSAHKWLSGPRGAGFLWVKKNFLESFPKFFPGGDALDVDHEACAYELAGGQDFALLLGLERCLSFHEKYGHQIPRRLFELREHILKQLEPIQGLSICSVTCEGSHPGLLSCVIDIDRDLYQVYQKLNGLGIHLKYLKEPKIFRISIPFYENKDRLTWAMKQLEQALCGKI